MKKTWTRLLSLVIVLAALLSLTGCGAKTEAPAAPAAAACPECPKVDTAAALADGMKSAGAKYFNALPSDKNMMAAADVQKLIDGKNDFFGVDIRANADFVKGHLPGFTNIPMGDVGKNLDKLPKDKLIIVQCASGQTSGQTVGVLRVLGYNAKSLTGGWSGITTAKLPTVTD